MMFIARIIRGEQPYVYPVSPEAAVLSSDGSMVLFQRRSLRAWRHKNGLGASAVSDTPHSAIASAKVLLEMLD
jgi:hypothetical protein